MLTRLTIAAVAACAVATAAPVAHAGHATVHCGVDDTPLLIGGTYGDSVTGLHGSVVSPAPGENVSIRCFVRVDGSEQGSTPTGTGTNVATTTGAAPYSAGDGQDVEVCTEWTAGAESDTTCVDLTYTQVPPQPVIDLLDQLFQVVDPVEGLDPVVCGVVQATGAPGVVNPLSDVTGLVIDPVDCDVYLGGELLLDFAPYGD